MPQNHANKMGTKPVFSLILSMSLPAMFSMLVQALYNIVDSIFVAKVSVDALTAVSIAFPVQMLLTAVGVGTGVGLNSLISRRLGEKRFDDANAAATQGLALSVFSCLPFVLFGLFFSRPFFGLFSKSGAIIEMGSSYLSIVTVWSLGCLTAMMVEKMIQSTGNMITPMITQLLGALTNIALDPIFIFGYFGVPRMGVAGAAIATVVGQFVAAVVALLFLFFKTPQLHIVLRGFRLRGAVIREIYAVGVPSIIMQAIGSVTTMGINGILSGFGDTAVAVLGAYYKLQSFVFMPVFGLNQGLMPIMGYNFGARNRKRFMSATYIGCLIALVIMGIGMLLFLVAPEALLNIFKEAGQTKADPELLAIGIPALRTICLCFLPAAVGIVTSTTFQATGHGMKSLIISLLRQLILLLPAAWLLSFTGNVASVWYAFPLAESISLVISLLFFLSLSRKELKALDQPAK